MHCGAAIIQPDLSFVFEARTRIRSLSLGGGSIT